MARSPQRKAGQQRRANAIDVHIGGRLRQRRSELGMTQERLGEALGLTFQQVQKYEHGTNRIGASRLYELTRILKVSVSYFYDELPIVSGDAATLDGMAEVEGEPYTPAPTPHPESLELLRLFVQIHDPRARRGLIELCRSLAQPPSGADTRAKPE